VRNLEQVRGYLKVLQQEINDPHKLAGGGSRAEWQAHTEKLDASLIELKRMITESDKEHTS